jgi:hypothetical protein
MIAGSIPMAARSHRRTDGMAHDAGCAFIVGIIREEFHHFF